MFSTNKDKEAKIDGKDSMTNEGGHGFDEAKDASRNFRDAMREAAPGVKEDLDAVARRTGGQARKWAETTERNIETMGEDLMAKVRRKPVQSSLAALGVGFVIGLLYKR